ncbi:hypothetical protein GmHk_11G032938 [Glycine max]|nr:hypothetical protein GmHk_11G032938 [Glycine max]
MNYCCLLDFEAKGGCFTWRKNIQNGGQVRKKPDRVMANSDWCLSFPHALVELLPMNKSDHNHLLLSCKKAKPLNFQVMRMSHIDYHALVKKTWREFSGPIPFKLGKI